MPNKTHYFLTFPSVYFPLKGLLLVANVKLQNFIKTKIVYFLFNHLFSLKSLLYLDDAVRVFLWMRSDIADFQLDH